MNESTPQGGPSGSSSSDLTLLQLADVCRGVHARAYSMLGPDLGGWSVLDLMADNVGGPLLRLEAALAVSGIAGGVSGTTLRNAGRLRELAGVLGEEAAEFAKLGASHRSLVARPDVRPDPLVCLLSTSAVHYARLADLVEGDSTIVGDAASVRRDVAAVEGARRRLLQHGFTEVEFFAPVSVVGRFRLLGYKCVLDETLVVLVNFATAGAVLSANFPELGVRS
jgi:hypothetical protein